MSELQEKEKGKSRVPCPFCRCHDNEVLRTRLRTRDGVVVRRHRCICGKRFSSEQHAKAA